MSKPYLHPGEVSPKLVSIILELPQPSAVSDTKSDGEPGDVSDHVALVPLEPSLITF